MRPGSGLFTDQFEPDHRVIIRDGFNSTRHRSPNLPILLPIIFESYRYTWSAYNRQLGEVCDPGPDICRSY